MSHAKSINPANGVLEAEYSFMAPAVIGEVTSRVHEAFGAWRTESFPARASRMLALAEVLETRKQEYAALMTREMGKVTREALAEVEKCAWACRYYAEHAAGFLADQVVDTEMARSFVTYQPIGIVLAIMPWNFPFWQVLRFAAPTLMAGNAALLKHAPNVSGCALAIEEAFRVAGFPENLFRTLVVDVDDVASVIKDPRVRAVTLTGSTRAGRAVAALAGEHLKKSVLELGGSDAYIVLEDADIESAAKICATSRLMNAGQSCIAAKRFVVVDTVYDAFVGALSSQMKTARVGDPTAAESTFGPLATARHRDDLHAQVEASVAAGATLRFGGVVPDGPGAFYPPTMLTEVGPGMPAYDEELFGPVASVIRVADEAAALEVANDTQYGLGGAVFTQDIDRGVHIARTGIDAGACTVNGFVASDPRMPFGGVKASGYGRELSHFGIHEFVNIKSVGVAG